MSNFYTVSTLAKLCGVSDRTIERWWAEGKLPAPSQVDGAKRWSPEQARQIMRDVLQRRITKEQDKRKRASRGR